MIAQHSISQTQSTSSLKVFALGVTLALAACGGGGGGDDSANNGTSPATPGAPASTLQYIPQITAMPANTYAIGSIESEAFSTINRLRSECGFGQLTQDTRLDSSASKHSAYMVENFTEYGHNQGNKAHPLYSGHTPNERMITEGYPSDGSMSEGMFGGSMFNQMNLARASVASLMTAPYHGLDILSNRQNIGIGFQKKPDFTNHNLVVGTFNYGSPSNKDYQPIVQDLPSEDVLTYPCMGTQIHQVNFFGEVPDPLPGRNPYINPVGHPIYMVAKKGSNLTINSIKLTQQATGKDIPLMPARYSSSEKYPGTDQLFGHANIMDWAFVFPDVGLERNTLYRVDLHATVSGKQMVKSFTFSTTAWEELERAVNGYQ